jgi:hypothetical protein
MKRLSNKKNNINEYYVFIGNTNEEITNILKKIEDRKNISKEEVSLLDNKYKKYYKDWINITMKRDKIKFIKSKIRIDDTISDIRKKIFIYLSDEESKSYILPENQELWLSKKDNTMELIGYYYENIILKEKNIIKPHIYQEFKFDNLLSFNELNLKKNTSENNMLIYDLLEDDNFNKKIIYLSDAKDEEKYLKENKKIINENLINNYFKKYWPYVNLSYNVNDIKNTFILMKDYYLKENYIFDLINNIPKNKDNFGSCNLITIKLSINDNKTLDNKTLDNESDKTIDLFPIFDYLKDKEINEKTPFIKCLFYTPNK